MKIIQLLYAPTFRDDNSETGIRVMVGREVLYGLGNDGNVYVAIDRGEKEINVNWQLFIDELEVVDKVESRTP